MTKYWHPFADMRAITRGQELVIDRADGYYVYDTEGRRYLDATASLWYCNVGHGRTEIAQAAFEQMQRLEAYSTFGDFTNPPVMALTDRLSRIAPVPDSVSFLTSGGSDSIDTAIKLARLYHKVKGEPQRTYVLSRFRAYHGMHTGGTSMAGIAPNLDGYGPLLSDTRVVGWDSHDDLIEAMEELGPENIAAFVCEPVIGAGGVLAPPPGYLEKVRGICRDSGILFISDEVITGFGRTGMWFASERWNLAPDLMTCAKGITSGYLPLGAVIVAPWIAEPWFEGGAGMWRHGYTYSGHATVAAAANANLDIIEREGLVRSAAVLEAKLANGLSPLTDHHLISEVRAGVGAMAAVQLSLDAVDEDPGLPDRLIGALREHGILTRILFGHAVQVSPPFTLDDNGVGELADGIRGALDAVA
ncbi:MAG: aminotransferase class III-fold pyridoxal phosphate-dependent enzyme [bacterium]|nr:aminotransferase class III-fold pyridoxal phosphate-dependent enzyme [bacterium]MDE0287048.1 aminotransferase class III-fold pyridoxal phosphate-dependent enzyme [bacterium]MDE0440452.1 aminotransferase class III-fold pyridoxal phosphate-dependent enzyme [bacterium]